VTTADLDRLGRHESPPDDLRAVETRTLVERAQQGDAAAWEALYLAVYPRLLGFARRQLDDDSAREAVSETMARAVSGIGRFSWKGAGFEGWLFGILRHVVVDTHRTNGRAAATSSVPDRWDGSDASDGLVNDEEAAAVRAAFASLRPDDQELLYLRVVSGLSSEDVAAALGKRPGAVRMAQARALERMRRLLGDET
jgi:RNA polymerase sigma-70 factor (ECF subfamily)